MQINREYFAIFMMTNIHEQRINIKMCVKLGEYFIETHIIMQNVYGDQCLGRTQCYDWFKRFKDDHMPVDDRCSGTPSMSNDRVT